MKFLLSLSIWFFIALPCFLIGIVFVPIALKSGWEGYTTIWGNYKYGKGTTHFAHPTNNNFWLEYNWLAFRNPCSNLGKRYLCAPADASWPWFIEKEKVLGKVKFGIKYGWKTGTEEGTRTFLFRPYMRII